MSAEIYELSQKRRKWVEASRENDFEEGIKRLLTDLYPDNAHFIYELLQNAEDARASEVRFTLCDEFVEFEHNGARLFSFKDVDAITSIGVSTKKDEPTNIGKFGVGFKAVYAYTMTPRIKSGPYHFYITDMVVPNIAENSHPTSHQNVTRFVLPFDNPKKPKERARKEIEKNLRQLNESTLLFLSNIQKVEYYLPDSTTGRLWRSEAGTNRIEIFTLHPGESEPASAVFLRFDKTVDVEDEEDEGKVKSCRIAVAYSMERVDAKPTEKQHETSHEGQWRVQPLQQGRVFIYFPAEKETSNLRLHLHAPFASTVARDSIRDCGPNNELRDHLADLIIESLRTIRDEGMLNVGFLAVLPNDKDNLPSFYQPVQDKLIRAFQYQKLTPMKRGGHAAALETFKGSSDLSELIQDDDLIKILGKNHPPPIWVANAPQRNQREDNFLAMLRIPEWTIDKFLNLMDDRPEAMTEWMASKSDEWHQKLYALFDSFLSYAHAYPSYVASARREKLSSLAIVRLNTGRYSIGKHCYFPDDEIENEEGFPRVAKGIYSSGKNKEQQDKGFNFLKKIGVREVGEAERIEAILKRRYAREAATPDMKTHCRDIKRFIEFIDKNPEHTGLFKGYYLFQLSNEKWTTNVHIYLDLPFMATGLKAYFDALGEKVRHYPLSTGYLDCGIDIPRFLDFCTAVGAVCELPIIQSPCSKNPEWEYLSGAPGGYRYPSDDDFTVENLDVLLKSPTLDLSRLVWRTMNDCPDRCLTAAYKKSEKGGCRYAASQLVHLLKDAAWIPQKGDILKKPCEAVADLLPDGFPYDKGKKWLAAVKFGVNAQKQSEEYVIRNNQAQVMGFRSAEEAEKMANFLDLCKAKGVSIDELISKIGPLEQQRNPAFPKKPVMNPERRQERFAEQLLDAPEKKYEKLERSVRTTKGSIEQQRWLRECYTNDAGQMVCQICKHEMPFKKRNGEYYFESVEVLNEFSREHEAQYLALCPLCAAMYKEFVKSEPEAMRSLKNALLDSTGLEIPLHLGELQKGIRFVETHLQDLKTVLNDVTKPEA